MPSNYQISSREFAVFRHIWKLEAREADKLDVQFLLRTTVGELEELLDSKSHRSKDLLIYQGSAYEIVELDCKLAGLELGQELLLSFRKQEHSRLYLCLARVPAGGSIIKPDTVKRLVDTERN